MHCNFWLCYGAYNSGYALRLWSRQESCKKDSKSVSIESDLDTFIVIQ